jgi:hypothetical protein
MLKKISITVIIGLSLVGCGSTSFFYKSGKEVHVAACTGPSWANCLRIASNICQGNGYDVVEKTSAKVSGFFTNSDYKELIYSCKIISQTPEKSAGPTDTKPQSPEVSNTQQSKSSELKTPDTNNADQPKSSEVKTPDTNNTEQPKASEVKTPDTNNTEQPKASEVNSSSSVNTDPNLSDVTENNTKPNVLDNPELLKVDEKAPIAKTSKSKSTKQKTSKVKNNPQ